MTVVSRDASRTHALHTLAAAGAVEDQDWQWARTPVPPGTPLVLDSPTQVAVYSWDPADGDPPAPVILVTASAVRKLGGRSIAARMESGEFPAEMPYATAALDAAQEN